jgi:hypothetical protein
VELVEYWSILQKNSAALSESGFPLACDENECAWFLNALKYIVLIVKL